MAIRSFIIVLLASFSVVSAYYYSSDGGEGGNKLLLILVDGCRWDYPDQDTAGLPGFRKLAENGVRAPYVTPIFPSNSYPNWYTIMTGRSYFFDTLSNYQSLRFIYYLYKKCYIFVFLNHKK